jgi:hypothetical protein
MKFRYWCDSGANIHSCLEGECEIEMTEEEFAAMSDEEKEEMMRGYAFERLDWGWERVK